MKKGFLRCLGVILSVTVASAALNGCGAEQKEVEKDASKVMVEPMELEPVHALSFNIIGGKDVMPVTGYYGPHLSAYSQNGEAQPEMINDKYYEMIKECGVNVICYTPTDYEYTPEYVQRILELGDKHKLGCFVTDTRLSSGKITGAEAAARVNNYANYASFCGVHVVDEPFLEGVVGDGTKDMKDYVPVFDLLKSMNIYAGSNLLPSTSFHKDEDFETYAEKFVEICDAPYLSFDYYLFDKGRSPADFFYNLSVYREAANKAEIPLWVFVQAGSQWNDASHRFDSETPYYPNEKQFDWNINTSLAYGAKGIQYFPLIQPYWFAWAESTEFDFERNSLIGAWGNKNQWFYYAKDMQAHISAIDEVLMNSVNKGVLISGEQATADSVRSNCILEGTSWRELSSIDGDAMVGCFNYLGKTALYVVNYDMEYAQNIRLTFQNSYQFSVIQDAQKEYYQGNGIELAMQAGEGVLIVFES